MAKGNLPLKEVSIETLYLDSDQVKYEIPIYQRNYAWEKDEIQTLIQDVFDAYQKDPSKYYYIGTLVSFHKGDNVFEIIDGQQRLTTIRIILAVLGIIPKTRLTYKARRKSDETLKHLQNPNEIDEVIGSDSGIINGYKFATNAYEEIVRDEFKSGFKDYFRTKVHLIHYKVPKDIDLNHYFEIMNSRGEQLEKHEIVKANLMQALGNGKEAEVEIFNQIWECCSDMNIYVQQNLKWDKLTKGEFGVSSYKDLLELNAGKEEKEKKENKLTLNEIIKMLPVAEKEEDDKSDSFQPIIDFSNFLLIVLKITMMDIWKLPEEEREPNVIKMEDFVLDDKELLDEFNHAKVDPREFLFNLLKARYLLDNYIVHHSKEEDTVDNNPWKLQRWIKDKAEKNGAVKGYAKNLSEDNMIQDKLVHLLSMFEVSFTARQRKNYLFYCLLYLMGCERINLAEYADFVEKLAMRYFHNVYLNADKLNSSNVPIPGAFDESILKNYSFDESPIVAKPADDFYAVFGDGKEESKGVPLFVFNYMDYLLWKKYSEELRGEKAKEGSRERKGFFAALGCSDFGLKIFDQFYFSRTRRSLEHFYPQATADGKGNHLDQKQINCFGNYAMIGHETNSAGSNWSPKTKLDHYLDSSGKISQISVASLKFMIMMQICHDLRERDDNAWTFKEIEEHQKTMVDILCNGND